MPFLAGFILSIKLISYQPYGKSLHSIKNAQPQPPLYFYPPALRPKLFKCIIAFYNGCASIINVNVLTAANRRIGPNPSLPNAQYSPNYSDGTGAALLLHAEDAPTHHIDGPPPLI